jgi:hypothetical protein
MEMPIPTHSGYNGTHSFPQSFGNSNSYSAGLQHGEQEAARDDHHQRRSDQRIAVTPDRDQARNERQPISIDHDKYSRKGRETKYLFL